MNAKERFDYAVWCFVNEEKFRHLRRRRFSRFQYPQLEVSMQDGQRTFRVWGQRIATYNVGNQRFAPSLVLHGYMEYTPLMCRYLNAICKAMGYDAKFTVKDGICFYTGQDSGCEVVNMPIRNTWAVYPNKIA